jgi:hypothetical protein
MKKPDVSEIVTLYTGLKDNVFATMHANMENCHRMYDLDFAEKVHTPEGFDKYIPPTSYWIVQTGANQLITDSPTVEIEAISDTEKAQKSADIEREFAEFLLKQMEIQNEASPLKECAVNLCSAGMAVLKGPLFDAGAWKTIEKKDGEPEADYKERVKANNVDKRNNFPIYFRAIDPRTFYPDPSGRKTFVIESYTRLAMDIKNNWPAWEGYKDNMPFQEISWLEYWSKGFRSYLADSKEVFGAGVIPNVFNFLPYAWGYSGWGKTSPNGKPEERAVGLLNPIISALEEEARFKTAMGNHFRQNVYQPYAVDPSIKGEIKVGPGEINQNVPVRDGKIDGIAPFPVARINPDTYPILSSVLQDIQNTAASALLSGQGPLGDTSGYLRGIDIGQGRIKYRPPLRTLENMASQVIRNTLYMIKYVIKQPVPFGGGKFIRPDDILEPIIVNVSLEPEDPAENDRKIKLGMELEARRIISTRKMREDYAGVSDVEESQQILIEDIKKMPQYQALLLGQAMEKYEMKALLDKLKQLEANGGIASQAAPYMGGIAQEQPGGVGIDIKQQQRLGALGGVNALNSQPETGVVNTGVAGAEGALPTKRGAVI